VKRFFSKTAFSLIELIVALTLMSVIVLGIFSINMVLVNNNQDYGQRYLVKSATQITLNHILNNASLAVGSANANDEPFLIGTTNYGASDPNGVGDVNSFCMHQAGGAGNNLINNASGIWLCYQLTGNQINWCAETYVPGNDPRGALSCSAASAGGFLIAGVPITFLGTAHSITTLNGVSSPPVLDPITGFVITIQNCLDDSAASCYNATPSLQDPANNPQVQISGSVFPPQMST
jgi:prepilin-type N-terminal cleavage/methylation domain-containing protein